MFSAVRLDKVRLSLSLEPSAGLEEHLVSADADTHQIWSDVLLAGFDFTDTGIQLDDVVNCIRTSLKAKLFAKAKDLMSLIVLYQFGGVTVDTTTTLVDPKLLQSTLLALKERKTPLFKVIRTPGKSAQSHFKPVSAACLTAEGSATECGPSWTPSELDATTIAGNTLYRGWPKVYPQFNKDAISVDVWLMHATPKHPAVRAAILDYVARSKAMGMATADALIDPHAKPVALPA